LPSPLRENIQPNRANGARFIDGDASELESSNEGSDSNDV